MADNKEEIIFDLLTGKDELNPALNKAKKTSGEMEGVFAELPKSITGIGSSISKFLTNPLAVTVGLVAGGVLAGFVALKDAIASAAEEQKQVAKLNNQLALVGEYSAEASKNIQEFASQMERSTGVSSEAALSQVALSVALGATTEQAKRIVVVSQNLAASLGVDSTTATEKLTKSLFGYSAGIDKLIPELRRFTDEQFRNGDALTFLEKKYNDVARSEFSSTFEGASSRISIAFGDVGKAIGNVIINNESLIKVLNNTSAAIFKIADFITSVSEGASIFDRTIISVTETLAKFSQTSLAAGTRFEQLDGSFLGIVKTVLAAANNFKGYGAEVNKATVELSTLDKISNQVKDSMKGAFGKEQQQAFQTLRDELSKVNIQTIADLTRIKDERLKLLGVALQAEPQNEKEIAKLRLGVLKDFADKAKTINDKRLAEEKESQDKFAKNLKNKFEDIIPENGFSLFNIPKVFSTLKKIDSGLAETKDDFNKGFINADQRREIEKGLKGSFKVVRDAGIQLIRDVGSIGSALQGGAAGFVKTVANGFDKVLPGIGAAVTAIVDIFGAAPAVFLKSITDTITGIGPLLANIVTNAANLFSGKAVSGIVTGLIDSLPGLVQALAYSISTQFSSPAFWIDVGIAFIKGIISAIPLMVQGFIDGLKNGFGDALAVFGKDFLDIPKKFFEKMRDLFAEFNPISLLSKLFKFDGGGEGPVEKFLGFDFPFVKFAKGGLVGGKAKVSGDSPINDLIPALLSPGEIVLPRSILSGGVGQILDFLKQMGMDIPGFAFGGKIGKSLGGALGKALDVVSSASGNVINATGTTVRSIFGDQVGNLFDDILGTVGLGDKFTEIIKSLLKIGAQFDPIKLVKNPTSEIYNALGTVKGFLTEPLKKALKLPGLASGGLIPNGFNNDNFLTGLSSGEFVVNNSLTPKLEDFLNGNSGNNKAVEEKLDLNNALLNKLLQAIQQPMSVDTNINIGQESIANVILKLNRSNQRLA